MAGSLKGNGGQDRFDLLLVFTIYFDREQCHEHQWIWSLSEWIVRPTPLIHDKNCILKITTSVTLRELKGRDRKSVV